MSASSDNSAPAQTTPDNHSKKAQSRLVEALDLLETVLDPKVVSVLALMAVVALMQHPWVNGKMIELSRRLGNKPVNYSWEIGATTVLDLTLVTADYRRLTCAADETFGDAHCAYKADKKKRFPRDDEFVIDNNKVNIVQPYRTAANNSLVLVSGVWATPEIANRLHLEPSDLPVKEQTRFTALCEVEIVARPPLVHLRWDTGQKWYQEKQPVVARAKDCKIERAEKER